MARYTEAVCRLCRREGVKLFLKGTRCHTDKCSIQRRAYPPGQHGMARQKVTEYGVQLREKQRLKRVYGVLERQLRKTFREAARQQGPTGDNLIRLLERRLDTIVHRSGFAVSQRDSRQLVKHGHITVNGQRVDIPSYLVRKGDIVEVRAKSRKSARLEIAAEIAGTGTSVSWLDIDAKSFKATVTDLPLREEISTPFNEQLIVELYSR